MLHVTCDLCGKEVHPNLDQHFVVKIESFAAQDPCQLVEEDLAEDHLEAVSQLLNDLDSDFDADSLTDATRHFRYDLCSACYQKFTGDPLGRGQLEKLNFSEN